MCEAMQGRGPGGLIYTPIYGYLHCTLYYLHCTLYYLHCTLHNAQCTVYTSHYIHFTLYTLHTAHCTTHRVHWTQNTVQLGVIYMGRLHRPSRVHHIYQYISALHYIALQCCAVQFSTFQCSTVYYSAIHCSIVQYSIIQQCSALQTLYIMGRIHHSSEPGQFSEQPQYIWITKFQNTSWDSQ